MSTYRVQCTSSFLILWISAFIRLYMRQDIYNSVSPLQGDIYIKRESQNSLGLPLGGPGHQGTIFILIIFIVINHTPLYRCVQRQQ